MLLVGILLAQLVSTDLRPNRSDLADRVKRMDAAWVSHKDFSRRQAAALEISGAVMAFFSGQTGDACRALDRAMSALEKKAPAGLDALIVRSEPRVAKPGEDVKLTFGWAYSASDTPIKVLGKTYMVEPSKNVVVSVHAAKTEGVQRISFESGKERRVASINVVNDFDARVAKLKTSPTSSAIVDALQQVAAGTYETEIPAADWLARGERIQKLSWKAVEEIPAVDYVGTRFRVQIPAGAPTDAPVVIALQGAGGSENMFFESYGAGAAPKEAKKRGWVFMSPRSGTGAVPACLAWLRDQRRMNPRKVFVMGHSMGGGLALSKETLGAKPDALALFAPATAGSLPTAIGDTPVFLAVGKQEMAMLRTSAARLGIQLEKRPKSIYKQYDRCEHLMIVAEAAADAFRFFDKLCR